MRYVLGFLLLVFAACDSAPNDPEDLPDPPTATGKIEILAAPPDTTLRARGDTLRIDLEPVFKHTGGIPLQFEASSSANDVLARIYLNTLQVVGLSDMTADVQVVAKGEDDSRASLSFRVRTRADWCAEPESGLANYLPFVEGETQRFTVVEKTAASTGWGTRDTHLEGELTWFVEEVSCSYGQQLVVLSETFEAIADTTITNHSHPNLPPVSTSGPKAVQSSGQFEVEAGALLPAQIGSLWRIHSQRELPARFFPISQEPVVEVFFQANAGSGLNHSYRFTLDHTKGLVQYVESESNSRFLQSSRNLTLTRKE